MSKLSNGLADPEKALSSFLHKLKSAPVSKWPRSDANIVVSVYGDVRVPLKFARQLEDELATCAASCETFKTALQNTIGERDGLRGINADLLAALQFYADPFNRKDKHGDPLRVPELYDEMEFDAVAKKAIDNAKGSPW